MVGCRGAFFPRPPHRSASPPARERCEGQSRRPFGSQFLLAVTTSNFRFLPSLAPGLAAVARTEERLISRPGQKSGLFSPVAVRALLLRDWWCSLVAFPCLSPSFVLLGRRAEGRAHDLEAACHARADTKHARLLVVESKLSADSLEGADSRQRDGSAGSAFCHMGETPPVRPSEPAGRRDHGQRAEGGKERRLWPCLLSPWGIKTRQGQL